MYPESVAMVDSGSELPLHRALKSSRKVTLQVVMCLVNEFPNSVYVRGLNGSYPLHYAVSCADPATVGFLVSRNPSAVTSVDSYGQLPIHVACRMNGVPSTVAQLLMEHHRGKHGGLDVADNEGRTPLHHALAGYFVQPQTVQLLLKRYPAAACVVDSNGMLPLDVACSRLYLPFRRDIISHLLDANLFSVLKMTAGGQLTLELLASRQQDLNLQMETTEYLETYQDRAVRLVREAFRLVGEACGLDKLVVATVCSFALPKIIKPTKGEMTW